MLIVPEGSGYTLKRRWGALTDSAGTGRVDELDMPFDTLGPARAWLAAMQRKELAKGYKDAFGDNHVSPVDGKKLPMGQYPVGLNRAAPFGWGTQSVAQCIPALRNLKGILDEAISQIANHGPAVGITEQLGSALAQIRMVSHADSTMGSKLQAIISKAMRRAEGGGRFLPDPDSAALMTILKTVRNYVTKQTSYCME
jgi:hypothetical protein